MKNWIITFALIVCISGCTKEIDSQGRAAWKLDLVKTEQIEKAVEGGASLLSMVYPPAGAAAATLLGLLGYWRKKIKPNYVKAKTEANLYHTTASTIVAAIEELKETDNAAWKKLKKELGPMSINLENAVRGLRGLPVKE